MITQEPRTKNGSIIPARCRKKPKHYRCRENQQRNSAQCEKSQKDLDARVAEDDEKIGEQIRELLLQNSRKQSTDSTVEEPNESSQACSDVCDKPQLDAEDPLFGKELVDESLEEYFYFRGHFKQEEQRGQTAEEKFSDEVA